MIFLSSKVEKDTKVLYNQYSEWKYHLLNGHIKLPKLKLVKIKQHREIPADHISNLVRFLKQIQENTMFRF